MSKFAVDCAAAWDARWNISWRLWIFISRVQLVEGVLVKGKQKLGRCCVGGALEASCWCEGREEPRVTALRLLATGATVFH